MFCGGDHFKMESDGVFHTTDFEQITMIQQRLNEATKYEIMNWIHLA
jgi:hypothetical protein